MQDKTDVMNGTAWPVSPMDHRALLVELSHAIGNPELDAAILGEGNTSMRVDSDTFLVKASGCQLSSLGREELVHLRFEWPDLFVRLAGSTRRTSIPGRGGGAWSRFGLRSLCRSWG
jgi:hypothetical protein